MTESGSCELQEAGGRPHILLIGLTSGKLGNMESGNLGNYMIIEPLITRLTAEFPNSRIRTSIQLSDSFCQRFGISSLRRKRFWSYGKQTALATATDIARLSAWWLLRPLLGARAEFIINDSDLLSEIYAADLVIDFSGDIFGDNATFNKYLEGSAEILFARALGKPVVVLAGSPGPFAGWRRPVGKFVLSRVSLITNREPLSTELLLELGIDKSLNENTACPAFLFTGRCEEEVRGILEEEGIPREGSTVGLILSGWNMPEGPYDRVPRKPWELAPFVRLIEFLLNELETQVILISHSHRLDDEGSLTPGPDAAILRQIYQMVDIGGRENSLILLKQPYDAATTKGLVGSLDMLISGRLHGAISGLSQGVPTVIIDYGHEPRAHKLRGVARLLDLEEFVCEPTDSDGMIQTVSAVWTHKAQIAARLSAKIEEVESRAALNFEILHDVVR